MGNVIVATGAAPAFVVAAVMIGLLAIGVNVEITPLMFVGPGTKDGTDCTPRVFWKLIVTVLPLALDGNICLAERRAKRRQANRGQSVERGLNVGSESAGRGAVGNRRGCRRAKT